MRACGLISGSDLPAHLPQMGFKESDVESVVRANLNLAEAEIVAIVCGGLFV